MKTSPITIDFNNTVRGMVSTNNSIVFKANIPPKKSFCIFGSKNESVEEYSIHMISVKPVTSGNLFVRDWEKLFVIKQGNNFATSIKNFVTNIAANKFDIYMDTGQIQDYLGLTESIKLDFIKTIQVFENEEPQSRRDSVELFFVKQQASPSVRLEISDEFKKGVEHKSGVQEEVGRLIIQNKADVQCSEKISLSYYLHVKGSEFLKYGLYFNKLGIKIDNPREINFSEERESKFLKVNIKSLSPGAEFQIPIFIDYKVIPNPDKEKNIEFELIPETTEKALGGNIPGTIKILKDAHRAELVFKAARGEKLIYEYQGGYIRNPNIAVKDRILWVPDDRHVNEMLVLQLEIGNNSSANHGKVEISQVSASIKEMEPKIVTGKKNAADIFQLNKEPIENFSHVRKVFDEAHGEPFKIDLTFLMEDIKEINGNASTFIFTLELNVRVIQEKNIIWQDKFSPVFSFVIEKDLGDKWLALDFGTSAIVAVFDAKFDPFETKLFNLQARHENFLGKKFGKFSDPYAPEAHTPYLASDIILLPKCRIDDPEIIYISARSVDVIQYRKFVIPYLKNLIGYEKVPITDEYIYLDESGKEACGGPDTKKIISMAYSKIFEDYIFSALSSEEQRDFNKVILSIPNTFTPLHKQYLQDALSEKFKKIGKEHIVFISESDAVACYYHSKWYILNKQRGEKKLKDAMVKDEYIFIYDLGAGTLDLTYLRILKNAEKGPYKIEVLGKLGKSYAGNNLDTILAKEIIRRLMKKKTEKETANFLKKDVDYYGLLFEGRASGGFSEQDGRQMAMEFKRYIKDTMKPMLSEMEMEEKLPPLTMENPYFLEIGRPLNITKKELLESETMEYFMKSNSEDVISRFFRMTNKIDDQNHEKFPIHTIITSGRAIQFCGLKERVLREIKKHAVDQEAAFEIQLAKEELKPAVALGALHYAATFFRQDDIIFVDKPVISKFGVLHKDVTGQRPHFTEFVSPTTPPTSTYRVGDKEVFLYDVTNKINFRGCSHIDFIQAYSEDPAKDLLDGSRSYFKKMHSIPLKYFTDKNIEVNIKIDEEGRVSIRAGQMTCTPQEMMKIDMEQNEDYKESMWPIA